MQKKQTLPVLIMMIIVSGCISAEEIDTDTQVQLEDRTYDLDITAELEKHEYLKKLDDHTSILNRTSSLFCTDIVEEGIEQGSNETSEELKPRNINIELYNDEQEKITSCRIEEK